VSGTARTQKQPPQVPLEWLYLHVCRHASTSLFSGLVQVGKQLCMVQEVGHITLTGSPRAWSALSVASRCESGRSQP
jgi:hypothetical protein